MAVSLVEGQTKKPIDPSQREWYKEAKKPIAEILADLSKPIPPKYTYRLKDKGNAPYIPWYHACSLLDRCTGGQWDYAVTSVYSTAERFYVTVRITIYAEEGAFSRDGLGTELLKREVTDRETGEVTEAEIAYGDPSSNAESMALRRAASKFGLARYLYDERRGRG